VEQFLSRNDSADEAPAALASGGKPPRSKSGGWSSYWLLYLYWWCCAFGRQNAQRKISKPPFWANNAEKKFIFLDFFSFGCCAFGRAKG
jgi:hypothetical protein